LSYSLAGLTTFAHRENPEQLWFYPAPQPPLLPFQTKLSVGDVNEPVEQEADDIAEEVMRMPEHGTGLASLGQRTVEGSSQNTADASFQRNCDCGGTCGDCRKKEHHGHAKLQMKAAAPNVATGVEAPPIVHEVLSSPGQPLDSATRAFMEPKFGHDFSQVRVHTDEQAAESARAVGAKAYTVGQKIFFAAGEYLPGTPAGQKLLGHELAHVIQQRSAAPLSLRRQPAGQPSRPAADKTSQDQELPRLGRESHVGDPDICSKIDLSDLKLPRTRNGAAYFEVKSKGIRFLAAVDAKQSAKIRKIIPGVADQMTKLNAVLNNVGIKIELVIVTYGTSMLARLCGQPVSIIDVSEFTAETGAHEGMHSITNTLLELSQVPVPQGAAARNFLDRMADIYHQLDDIQVQIAPGDVESASNLVDPHTLNPKEPSEHPQQNVDEFISSAAAVFLNYRKALEKKIAELGKQDSRIISLGADLVSLLDDAINKQSLPAQALPFKSTPKQISDEIARIPAPTEVDEGVLTTHGLLRELLIPP
jgi:uncharacterized protein DUF4157